MYKEKSVCVVVPAYNESKQISKVIETMPDFIDAVIIIDDASTDKTVEIVKNYEQQNEKITLIQHDKNQGVGGAIATGYKWARDNDFDMAVVMAGDGQMDPVDLPILLDPVAEDRADYSKGNRLFTGEAYTKIPRIRYIGNAFLSLLTKIASGYWHVADSQSGYTVINKRALHLIDWEHMYKRYGQPNDLLTRLNVYNLRVADIPIEPVYNVGETSGLKIKKVIFTISWLLLKMFLWRLKEKYIIRDFHPLVFFYFMGLILFPFGLISGIYLFLLRIFSGPVAETSALFAAILFITGLQFLFFAMWFDMEANKDLKA
jgi:glycosyltransferase involved in cell wall biosynthesis